MSNTENDNDVSTTLSEGKLDFKTQSLFTDGQSSAERESNENDVDDDWIKVEYQKQTASSQNGESSPKASSSHGSSETNFTKSCNNVPTNIKYDCRSARNDEKHTTFNLNNPDKFELGQNSVEFEYKILGRLYGEEFTPASMSIHEAKVAKKFDSILRNGRNQKEKTAPLRPEHARTLEAKPKVIILTGPNYETLVRDISKEVLKPIIRQHTELQKKVDKLCNVEKRKVVDRINALQKGKKEAFNRKRKADGEVAEIRLENSKLSSELLAGKKIVLNYQRKIDKLAAELQSKSKLESEIKILKKELDHNAVANENKIKNLLLDKEKADNLIAELKSEIQKLKGPQSWIVKYWMRTHDIFDIQNMTDCQPQAYTICIKYADDLLPQLKPVIDDMVQLLIMVLEPLTHKGYAIFKFVHHMNASQADVYNAVIVVSKLTSNRVRIRDRQIYGSLNAMFGAGEGRIDRRHMVLLSAAQPTNQSVVPFDDNNEMDGIPKNQLIKQNMSMLFMSGMREKQLIPCGINTAVINEISKWIIDITPRNSL